jgi:hypothetical protein
MALDQIIDDTQAIQQGIAIPPQVPYGASGDGQAAAQYHQDDHNDQNSVVLLRRDRVRDSNGFVHFLFSLLKMNDDMVD